MIGNPERFDLLLVLLTLGFLLAMPVIVKTSFDVSTQFLVRHCFASICVSKRNLLFSCLDTSRLYAYNVGEVKDNRPSPERTSTMNATAITREELLDNLTALAA